MYDLVDIDDVLDLFGCSDRDIYAKGVITDALHDGTLKMISSDKLMPQRTADSSNTLFYDKSVSYKNS